MLRRVTWFIVVGSTSAGVHLLTVMGLVSQLGWHPLAANIVAWLIAFCISFMGHYHLSFPRSGAPLARAAARFLAISATGFAINEATYALLLHLAGTHWYAVILFFVLIGVAVMTWILSSRWAFRGTGPA
ncbi:GtrA family protein [Ramlibacter sp. PS4R-6]|uniref:GtrA family protein n=1 Tax=Ramlibacter sp. PS4R-6 TaxID=3133438 RepID=UPI00309758CC